MDNNEFLKHYGILGMHWGKRKGSTETSTSTKNSADHEKVMELKKKKLSEMSNDDLRAFTQRINLEKQYKELSKPTMHPVRKFAQDFLLTQGKQALNQVAAAQQKKLVDELLKKTSKTVT